MTYLLFGHSSSLAFIFKLIFGLDLVQVLAIHTGSLALVQVSLDSVLTNLKAAGNATLGYLNANSMNYC